MIDIHVPIVLIRLDIATVITFIVIWSVSMIITTMEVRLTNIVDVYTIEDSVVIMLDLTRSIMVKKRTYTIDNFISSSR